MTNKFGKICVLTLLCAGFAGTAQAGQPSGVVTATGDVSFTSPSSVSLSVTPVSGLVAGAVAANTKVATGAASATDPQKIAYRWTPGTGDISGGSIKNLIKIKGKNDPANIISLKLNSDAGFSVDGGNGWIVPLKPTKSENLTVITPAAETVNADTYVVSIDAAEWVS